MKGVGSFRQQDGGHGSRKPLRSLEALEIPEGANISIWECMSSEGVTNNPLKKRSFRKPLDHPISDSDQRRVKEFFQNCEDGTKTLYYHL